MHGHDIARTVGERLPIDPGHVPMILAGMHQVMPGWGDPATAGGRTATYQVRQRAAARALATWC
ncbi:hypothetical protein [Actinomadura sediminis]|uniref:Uncharacterized protein n=1 Tax=Actinomadura sediminis TaxID=1038904 RepID=A0ABW3EQW0_9ACTN